MNVIRRMSVVAIGSLSVFLSACSSDGESAPKAPDNEYHSDDIIGIGMKDEPKISYCMPRYLSDPQTRTIYEVFSGDELAYGHLIMRSDPNKRAGMYFFVMFGYEHGDIGLACRFVLEIDTNDFAQPRTFNFDVHETSSVLREIKLGITGKDWPNKDASVNAWKLTLLSADGKILTQKESWLWSVKYADKKPDGAAQTAPEQKSPQPAAKGQEKK